MPGDIIEITPEPDPRTKPQPAAFAGPHTEIHAEITSQSSEQALRGRSPNLPRWLALAVASGAVVALGFVYFLAR